MEKITNPLTGQKVFINSQEGEDILYLNELCKKCPKDKIYNNKTKKCVSRTTKKDTLLSHIEYCNALEKNKSLEVDNYIIKNLLNIKIPKIILGKSVVIKDLVRSNVNKYKFLESNIARKFNIKNERYRRIIHFSVVIILTIFSLSLTNSEVRVYLLHMISILLKNTRSNLAYILSKIFNLLKNASVRRLITFLSPRNLLVMITSLFSYLITLDRSDITDYSVNKITTFSITGGSIPMVDVRNAKNLYKQLTRLTANERNIIKNTILNKYVNDKNQINLYNSGLNSAEIYNAKDLKFKIDYSTNIPYVSVVSNIGNNMKDIQIYNETDREKILNDVKQEITNELSKIADKKQEINSRMTLQTIYNDYSKKKTVLEELTKEKEKVSDNKPKLSMINAKISKIKDETRKLKNKIKDFEEIPYEKYKELQTEYEGLIELEAHLKNFKTTQLNLIKKDNINAELPNIQNFISQVKDHRKSLTKNILVSQLSKGKILTYPKNIKENNINIEKNISSIQPSQMIMRPVSNYLNKDTNFNHSSGSSSFPINKIEKEQEEYSKYFQEQNELLRQIKEAEQKEFDEENKQKKPYDEDIIFRGLGMKKKTSS